MTALLLVNGMLLLLAVKRGWRVGPFVLLVIPALLAKLEPHAPHFSVGGWVLPFANLTVVIGALCTCSLLYTAIADPERV